jgi:hypothetical protein
MSVSTFRNEFDRSTGALEEERTLRLLATLPAPEGLEDRVKEGLRSAPRQAKVMLWPFSSAQGGWWMRSAGVRSAAAAAIVLVIAGGGWEVYSHIQPAPLPTAVSAPQPLNGAGSFHSAGAIRVPQTLQGPVVPKPAISSEKQKRESTTAISQKQGKRSPTKKSVQPVPAAR